MSAYGIGSDTATIEGADRKNSSATNVPQTIIKWIPGEAITFYAAIIGIGIAQGAPNGDETDGEILERIQAGAPSWFAVGAAIAVALVILGAYSAPRDNVGPDPVGRRVSILGLGVRCLLALIAFALWTGALPGSWPYGLSAVRDMGPAYALLLVPAGLIFAGAAEALTKKIHL